MVYADVVVGKRGSSGQLTYAVSAKIIPYIRVGSLVVVPIRDKKVRAIVVRLHRRVDIKIKGKIREIFSIDKNIPSIPSSQLEIAEHLAKKYLTNVSDIVLRILSMVRPTEQNTVNKRGKTTYLQAVWTSRVKFYLDYIGKYKEVLIIFPTRQHLEEFKKNIPSSFSHSVVILDKSSSLKKIGLIGKVLLLGTVGGSFFPIEQQGLIIIDQPNHIGSRYSNRPYLKSEDIASARALYEGTDILVAQSIISPLQLIRVKNKEATLVSIAPKETAVTVNSRVGNRDIFLPSVKEKISQSIKDKKSICLFVASKGWASGYYCRNCQELIKCNKCGRITGATPENLICNYCGNNALLPSNCPNCGKNDLIALGEGLDKITKEVIEVFKGTTFQITAGQAGQYNEDVKLTIATEKILSFPTAKFDQIIIVSADRALSGGAIDDQWKFLLILKELSAICNKLTIQTYLLENRVWGSLTASGVKKYFVQELSERKRFNLPPYSKELTIIGVLGNGEILEKQLDKIVKGIEKYRNIEYMVSEFLKDKTGQTSVRIQIIFPLNKSYLLAKFSELIPPNWAVLPS